MTTYMSDEVRDGPVIYPCCPCSKDDTIVESSRYCADCSEYLCDSCLGHYIRLSVTAGHKVREISPVLVTKDRATTLDIKWKPSGEKLEINGMCTVRRGHFLLAITEWRTQQVMLVDLIAHKCVDTLRTQSKPYGINYLPASDTLVASLYETGEVAIIGLTNKLKLKINRYVKVSMYCRGLDVVPGLFSDSLVIVSGAHNQVIHIDAYAVLTKDAELYPVNNFTLKAEKRAPLVYPLNILVDAKRQKLYVTDRNVGVVVLDANGKRVGLLSDPCLEGACAICSDVDGNVYVGGLVSANIVKFDGDGKCIGEIVNKLHGLKCPVSMCFDNTSKSLVIGSKDDHLLRTVRL